MIVSLNNCSNYNNDNMIIWSDLIEHKKEKARERGLTLVAVPCWWPGDIEGYFILLILSFFFNITSINQI